MSRRVVVFTLGGTIAMTPAATGGVALALSAADLVAVAVPGPAETGIDVEVVDFRRLPGASLDFGDLLELLAAISATTADGIVITQGTDTIEESAYLLDLYHHEDRPVVVTGAMRNPSLAGADGPANLLAAIRTAASESAAGHGVLVVLADEIHSARRVRKTHSTGIATFQSPNGGPLGYLVEGRPCLLNRITGRLRIPLPAGAPARVGLVTVTLGDQGEVLEGTQNKVDGLVIAGMGGGHVPDRLVATLERMAAAMPVVLASRTGSGPVLVGTYGFAGSERDLIGRGLIPAGFLDPLKARILLTALISSRASAPEIAQAFATAS